MSSLFDVVRIDNKHEIEYLGTKEKFWFYTQTNQKALFKIGRKNTRENLSEKVAYEIAKRINLSVAKYDFAQYRNELGTLSYSVVNENERLVLGNELLGKFIGNYPKEQFYNVREYKIDTVLSLLKLLEKEFSKSLQFDFIAYLIFDCLISNQDRHHENWGLIVKEKGEVSLSPSYDHASSLGCRENIIKIEQRLVTKDSRFNIESFCNRAKSPFFNSKQLKTLDVVKYALKHNKKAVEYGIDSLEALRRNDLIDIFNQIPQEFQEKDSIYEFMIRIVEVNKKRLQTLLRESQK